MASHNRDARIIRWSANRTVQPGVNWVSPFIKVNGPINIPIKHTLQMGIDGVDTIVNVIVTTNGVPKTFSVNQGVKLVSGAGYQFDLLLMAKDTYNLQHVTGTQNPFVKLFESPTLEV
jgi:hypothetical protein